MIFGVKQMGVLVYIGTLPEEELSQQEIFLDIALKTDREDINEYFLKEIAEKIGEKGFTTLQQFAKHLHKSLMEELSLNSVELTVTKPHSPSGIATYVTYG